MSELTATTQLAILLTARWSVNGVKPLSTGEFVEFRRWLGASPDAAQALLMGRRGLEESPIEASRVQGLLRRGLGVFHSIDRWLHAGLWVASYADENYPVRFRQLKLRAPVLLFGYGNPNAFGDRALAIVGSRNASEERIHKTSEIGRACAAAGVTVVSGGARGVDSAAMSAGIVGSGTVVGVLADSLLKESGRKDYRDAIRDGRLCLMSEVHPEARFDVGSAMARNRLAYACADAALVIECDINKGGTWAGAMEALREGKPVYVLKGARAERQLGEKGATRVDIDFAVQVDRLIKSERPGPTPERVNLVEVVLRELLANGGLNKEALAGKLRDDAVAIAARLVDAAITEGWAETLASTEPELSGEVVPAAPVVKRTRRSSKRPEATTGVLFTDEAIAG